LIDRAPHQAIRKLLVELASAIVRRGRVARCVERLDHHHLSLLAQISMGVLTRMAPEGGERRFIVSPREGRSCGLEQKALRLQLPLSTAAFRG